MPFWGASRAALLREFRNHFHIVTTTYFILAKTPLLSSLNPLRFDDHDIFSSGIISASDNPSSVPITFSVAGFDCVKTLVVRDALDPVVFFAALNFRSPFLVLNDTSLVASSPSPLAV